MMSNTLGVLLSGGLHIKDFLDSAGAKDSRI